LSCKAHVCNCNNTMQLNAALIGKAVGAAAPLQIHTAMCRADVTAFAAALDDAGDNVVACTQEAALLSEAAASRSLAAPVRFVNIRETGGWGEGGAQAQPKIAALLAAAMLPEPEPLPSVTYASQGRTLIVGPAALALPAAELLAAQLPITVLLTDSKGAALPADRSYPLASGNLTKLTGWLGAFEAQWQTGNPIDLELCTRCNACIAACPEDAIGADYQVDLAKCKSHRACVTACGSIGAIDFARKAAARSDTFDVVLDLRSGNHFTDVAGRTAAPQGYVHCESTDQLPAALAKVLGWVGEFDKPKFFNYKASICAHSRNEKEGCNRCIDICSTKAISADGDHVKVEPHLCMGCGACAATCPSGAMTYQAPRMPDVGKRIKTLLATYRNAGGKDAVLLLHGVKERSLIDAWGRAAARKQLRGVPAHVVPFEVTDVAAVGLDLVLGTLAYGAARVALLATDEAPPQYVEQLHVTAQLANVIAQGVGVAGEHVSVLRGAAANLAALEAAVYALPPVAQLAQTATFHLSESKRTTIEFCIDHIAKQTQIATPPVIALPTGSPFGAVQVNKDACTLCMACVGTCPASALADNQEAPQLRFIERNCVQCGLCEKTCPENAITLVPQLNLAPSAKEKVVLNESQPFHCIKCGKPFGTQHMITGMLTRLSEHSMFAGNTQRLKMCADCRVVDMMENKKEISIFDVKR
jgi:ferredoxin